MSSYVINLEEEEDIPFCIICQENMIENASHTLTYNDYCTCKFHYHQMCYEKWINLVKQKQCLICRNDISMNFLLTKPFDEIRSNSITRRRPSFINVAMMSPRTRHRYGIPFMYNPRRISYLDRICNILSCQEEHQLNPVVDWLQDNYDCFIATMLTMFCISLIFVSIIFILMIG
tara:strand:+ start:604 stop:1128 length:525 start_codon:yes stop_codon:yes gene_type:complete